MKSINYDEVKIGDLVEVPRHQFAPNRKGWNGWLFSEAIVIEKRISQKNNRPVIKVEMRTPKGKNDYGTVEKTFYADCVFMTNKADIAKQFMKEDGVSNKEEFYKYIEREDVTGCDWIRFLVEKGFLF